MRWATFRAGDQERIGPIIGEQIQALSPGLSLMELIKDGEGLSRWANIAAEEPTGVFELSQVMLLPPVTRPLSVRDFYAFEQHVRTARQRRGLEMDPDWYELPVFYFSNPAALIGDGADIAIPPGSKELDFELEVAAIVGRGGSNLDPVDAESHIAGYCVMNDWSARDIQRREMKLSMGPGKGKDFATTLGPWLTTPDEIEPCRKEKAFDLAMRAEVNGVEYS